MVRSRWGQEAPASIKDQPLALSSQPALARTLDQGRGSTKARKRLWEWEESGQARPCVISQTPALQTWRSADELSRSGQTSHTGSCLSELSMNVATVNVGMDR